MWWSDGVATAIQACQTRKSVLVVLVEPSSDVIANRTGSPETSLQLLSRVSTTSMHAITFSNEAVKAAAEESGAVFLKFPSDDDNVDFIAFKFYFKIAGHPPNLYFISPLTGATLTHHAGFVPVSTFLRSLASATVSISGKVIEVPDVRPPSTLASQLAALQHCSVAPDEEEDSKEANAARDSRPAPGAVSKPVSVGENASLLPSEASPPQKDMTASRTSRSMKLPASDSVSAVEDSKLLARLPNGGQVRKNFSKTTTFSTVRNWLSEEVKSPANVIVISTAFPRRVFDLGENPKMLSELGLFPSETLIVSIPEKLSNGSAQSGPPLPGPAAGLKSYAASAVGVVASFFRSFVADTPGASPEAHQPPTSQSRATASRGTSGSRRQTAMRLEHDREDGDENLLSNGNSTQYGWNPRDDEEES